MGFLGRGGGGGGGAGSNGGGDGAAAAAAAALAATTPTPPPPPTATTPAAATPAAPATTAPSPMDIEAPRTGATVSTAMHTGASSIEGRGTGGGGGGIGGGSLDDDGGGGGGWGAGGLGFGLNLGRTTTNASSNNPYSSGGGSLPPALPPLPPLPAKRPRIYEVWQGNERFFCWGHCMAGPSWRSCFGSAALILLPTAALLAWVAPYMGRSVSWALLAVSCALPCASVAFLLRTACVDPGVLPRQAPDEEWLSGRKPRSKDVSVRGHRVTVRYNDTCHFFQPPRAHHCSANDNCIQRFDHHCPWVGTTVGLRNYRSFLLFVYVTTAYVAWAFGLSLASLFVKRNELLNAAAAGAAPPPSSLPASGSVWAQALAQSPAALALMVYCFIFFWFVGGLAGFHTYLTATNQTTYENFRYNQGHPRSSNPYDEGVVRNCASVWCVRVPPPRIRFRAFADDESARPERVDLSAPSWREPLPPAEEEWEGERGEEEGRGGRGAAAAAEEAGGGGRAWRGGGGGGGRRARGEVPPPPATHAVSATQHIYDPPAREHGFVSGSQGGGGNGAAGAAASAGAPMSPLAAGALAPPPLEPPPLAGGALPPPAAAPPAAPKSQATSLAGGDGGGSVGGVSAYLSTQGSLVLGGGGGGSIGGAGGGG